MPSLAAAGETMTSREDAIVLHFFAGPAPRGPFSIGAATTTTLGRGRTCSVRIDHPSVSARHAAIHRGGDGIWTVTDLGSTNGTYLDEMALDPHQERPLSDRCLLGVGAWVFQVQAPPDAGPPPPIIETARPAVAPHDAFRTNPSIFLRLRHDDTIVRELSWEEFDRSYRPVILGFARNLGLPERDREDVLQIVLTKFFEAEDFEYDPDRRFRGLIKTMTRQAIIDHLRKERGERDRAIEHALRNPVEVEDRWNREWTVQTIQRAMEEARSSVTEQTWEAFRLAACDGRSASEVAEGLGMAADAVRQAKARAQARVEAIIRRIRATEG